MAKLMALLLSQCSVSDGRVYPMDCRRFVYHMSSAVVDANARYSTSAIDLHTVACFLAPQDSKFLPMKIVKLVVDP